MSTLKKHISTYLSAAIITMIGSQLSAFEQGTYFIYQAVDQIKEPTINKRLAVEKSIFIEDEHTHTESKLETAKRSEFEIDFNSLGNTSNSTFETTESQSITPPSEKSSSFNLLTKESTSLFGN